MHGWFADVTQIFCLALDKSPKLSFQITGSVSSLPSLSYSADLLSFHLFSIRPYFPISCTNSTISVIMLHKDFFENMYDFSHVSKLGVLHKPGSEIGHLNSSQVQLKDGSFW